MSRHMGMHIAKASPPAAARPAVLGSINCFIKTRMEVNGQTLFFDGTTLGMVKTALAAGAKAGDVVVDFLGGWPTSNVITEEPHDARCGFWAKRLPSEASA
jgi:hypothetical protein